MIKIKLYGESIHFHHVELFNDYLTFEKYNHIASIMWMPIGEAILKEDFFKMLNEQYELGGVSRIQDLILNSIGGLLNDSKSRIEIKKGRKILQRTTLQELFRPSTLFPLFNIKRKILTIEFKQHDFLIEKEVGLVAEYTVETEQFDISKLVFDVCKTNCLGMDFELLYCLTYDKKELKKNKSDTVLTYQYCLNI